MGPIPIDGSVNLISLFSTAVFAAEVVLSPVPDELAGYIYPGFHQPSVSFGMLAQPTLPEVVEITTETIPSLAPVVSPRKARKDAFTIAVIGDSMVDTLGPDIGGLPKKLQQTYPGVFFDVRNYGVGATNIDYGISRLTNDYEYLGVGKPSVVSQNPDIVVIESFGYNPYPFDEGALDKHWLALSQMVDIIKANLPEAKIVIAATIAPNWDVFGDGVLGWDSSGKRRKVEEIKRYIENTVGFAKSQNLPLADVYHPSLDDTGNGKLAYINPGDHIHYSDAGRELFSKKVFEALERHKLLE